MPASVRLSWQLRFVIKTRKQRALWMYQKRNQNEFGLFSVVVSVGVDFAIILFGWVACDQFKCALNTQFMIITLNYQLVYFIGLYFALNWTKMNWFELNCIVRIDYIELWRANLYVQFVQFVFKIGANI